MTNIELKKLLDECIRNQDEAGGEIVLIKLLIRAVHELTEKVEALEKRGLTN